MEELRERAARHFGVFSLAQAADCGVSDEALARAVRRGICRRLQAGVYAFAGSPESWEQSVMAACLAAGKDAAASHRAAARIWGLVPPDDDIVEISVPRKNGPTTSGGVFLAEVDFAYPELRLAIEVDGFRIHGTPGAMAKDFVRQNGLVPHGWHVLRFTWRQVTPQPDMVIQGITAALAGLQAA